jgi:hypothetical protein
MPRATEAARIEIQPDALAAALGTSLKSRRPANGSAAIAPMGEGYLRGISQQLS